jgi:hypothetical protein
MKLSGKPDNLSKPALLPTTDSVPALAQLVEHVIHFYRFGGQLYHPGPECMHSWYCGAVDKVHQMASIKMDEILCPSDTRWSEAVCYLGLLDYGKNHNHDYFGQY